MEGDVASNLSKFLPYTTLIIFDGYRWTVESACYNGFPLNFSDETTKRRSVIPRDY